MNESPTLYITGKTYVIRWRDHYFTCIFLSCILFPE